jgi:predicted N-acetyltransferase YhbS
MNKEIIDNLYEFWTYIGEKTSRLTETEEYKAVSMLNSDWPNRIFSISNDKELLTKVISLSQQELLPNIITISKPTHLENNPEVQLMFRQKNMALNIQNLEGCFLDCENIYQVKSQKDAINFANIASEAFDYHLDANTVDKINQDDSKIKIFIYQQDNQYLGCGIVYFDSSNNAGLHMIGTVPKGRGKGIGMKMTEKLLLEASKNGSNSCVLHASLMGKSMYKKLGFFDFEELETYKIKKIIQ